MTCNRGCDPKHGVMGQSKAQSVGKGGVNTKATPFGMKAGSSNHPKHASPQFGVKGQRLAGGGGGKATGYPPGYTSR